MKTKFFVIPLLIAITFGVILSLKTFPKQFTVNLEGIKYQLGAGNIYFTKPITIHIDGKLQQSLTGSKTFKGSIDIDHEKIPVPEDQRGLEIKFLDNGGGHIVYGYIEDGRPGTYGYGVLYTNSNFSEVTITILQKDETDQTNRGWTSENGQMITAPAANRAEALKISNELMQDYLKGNSLK
ncbi:hypothetical protein FQ087_05585 [Sporosarcina sp. ANT_H38]|uniref:hypothetical protein n=1 Tax=Sporosarcina sp. ANT_H38 TaxID=2597358 RepID=UPI0011F1D83D|nr:hypothetical protein [Sporosarcina sp. ANT_H38]KAA0965752.1 hypothetical protein FQ087_05585 [Sporosarcina sp. ANT_H38]